MIKPPAVPGQAPGQFGRILFGRSLRLRHDCSLQATANAFRKGKARQKSRVWNRSSIKNVTVFQLFRAIGGGWR